MKKRGAKIHQDTRWVSSYKESRRPIPRDESSQQQKKRNPDCLFVHPPRSFPTSPTPERWGYKVSPDFSTAGTPPSMIHPIQVPGLLPHSLPVPCHSPPVSFPRYIHNRRPFNPTALPNAKTESREAVTSRSHYPLPSPPTTTNVCVYVMGVPDRQIEN